MCDLAKRFGRELRKGIAETHIEQGRDLSDFEFSGELTDFIRELKPGIQLPRRTVGRHGDEQTEQDPVSRGIIYRSGDESAQ